VTDRPADDVVAPDGSPVAIYRALPRPAEADTIHAAIPAGSRILDLGAGTGRFARALADLGHTVVAVDHEPAMLAGLEDVPGIEPVVGEIAGLTLDPPPFDVALLASHLIDDDDLGPAALEVARRHVRRGGVVVAEVYPPGMDWSGAAGRRSEIGPVGITVTRAVVTGDRLDAAVRYDLGDRTWTQPFTARLLDQDALEARLVGTGLRFDRWLDERLGWFVARP